MKCFTKWLTATLAVILLASAALMAERGNTFVPDGPPARSTDPLVAMEVKPANAPVVMPEPPVVYCCGGGPTETQVVAQGKGDVQKWCCRGGNLVKNGDFESPINPTTPLGFTSDYQFNPAVGADATRPGQFNIVTKDQALKICRQWQVKDEYACRGGSGDSHVMVVNGETGKTGTVSIWKQQVTVVKGKQYLFCARVQHLAACCFDVTPKITVNFTGAALPNSIGPITLNPSVSGSDCDWQLIKLPVTANGSAITIDIRLDVSGKGDGNDVALDNISIQEVTPIALDFALSKAEFNPPVPGKFTLTANLTINNSPITVLPVGCTAIWKLYKYDPSGKPDVLLMNWATSGATFIFPGYQNVPPSAPGKFDDGQWYHITLDLICKTTDCSGGGFAEFWGKFNPKSKRLEMQRKQPAREKAGEEGKPLVKPLKTDVKGDAKAMITIRTTELVKAGNKFMAVGVSDARIDITQKGNRIAGGKSGPDGRLSVPLHPGTYSVVVTRADFKSVTAMVDMATLDMTREITLMRSLPAKK